MARMSRTMPFLAAAAVAAGACAAPMQRTTTSTSGGEVMGAMLFNEPANAATASASNQHEIQTSQLALERASSQAVRDYARRMIDHHQQFEQRQTALAASKNLTPMDNAHSLQMKRNLPPTLEMLRQQSGPNFDVMYIVDQIGAHKNTLFTIDSSLLPTTRDPEMQAMLRNEVRPAVVQHLQEAITIHHQLMAMPMQGRAGMMGQPGMASPMSGSMGGSTGSPSGSTSPSGAPMGSGSPR